MFHCQRQKNQGKDKWLIAVFEIGFADEAKRFCFMCVSLIVYMQQRADGLQWTSTRAC